MALTPGPIVDKLSAALEKVAKDKEFASTLDNLGTDVNYLDTDAYNKWLKENVTEMKEAMTKAGMI